MAQQKQWRHNNHNKDLWVEVVHTSFGFSTSYIEQQQQQQQSIIIAHKRMDWPHCGSPRGQPSHLLSIGIDESCGLVMGSVGRMMVTHLIPLSWVGINWKMMIFWRVSMALVVNIVDVEGCKNLFIVIKEFKKFTLTDWKDNFAFTTVPENRICWTCWTSQLSRIRRSSSWAATSFRRTKESGESGDFY